MIKLKDQFFWFKLKDQLFWFQNKEQILFFFFYRIFFYLPRNSLKLLLYSFLMSSFINNQIRCKKYILIFTFIFMFLTLHLFFYFYSSKSFTNSSPPLHISETSFLSIFLSYAVGILASILLFFCIRRCPIRLLS